MDAKKAEHIDSAFFTRLSCGVLILFWGRFL